MDEEARAHNESLLQIYITTCASLSSWRQNTAIWRYDRMSHWRSRSTAGRSPSSKLACAFHLRAVPEGLRHNLPQRDL